MTRAEKRRAARQQEKDKVRYQLTAEEIRQIEKKAVESKKEQIRDSIMKEVQEEWQRREEMLSGKDDGEIVQNVLCLLLAVPVKVLCEKFKNSAKLCHHIMRSIAFFLTDYNYSIHQISSS